ncbi:uncharacterized protein B0I36DRAFT_313199 [Microdochium trichocladiopsis]|uniref:Uncharacterized protein n=1 Tax=Microdochium trichocladiopsis TaxID=1682393 RepID=A0A9P8YFI5_9PEZI|nr:uncharacterized protein B0I36DRAFT_313199 [Microdochium trichocladiopsis]KAH7037044.1 hypothetical protein B0I36DRAFT_313199 [Microdochium trichocladiopsis]
MSGLPMRQGLGDHGSVQYHLLKQKLSSRRSRRFGDDGVNAETATIQAYIQHHLPEDLCGQDVWFDIVGSAQRRLVWVQCPPRPSAHSPLCPGTHAIIPTRNVHPGGQAHGTSDQGTQRKRARRGQQWAVWRNTKPGATLTRSTAATAHANRGEI